MKVRTAARVVLLNAEDEVFMLQCRDLGDHSRRYWFTVGGGAELGETSKQTAARELAEETGIECEPSDLLGPLATCRVSIQFSTGVLVQDEVYFGMRFTEDIDLDEAMWSDREKAAITGARWWSKEEVEKSSEVIYPPELPFLIDLVCAGVEPVSPLPLNGPGGAE
ncbi:MULTISPECIES: NUDIX hydrolase [unclassified Brevibacterium]|uniref:NUDIX hydrolase n=1 Tax=unclassified Brevibacterium TaxID=2614124 RepID=UPI0008A5CF16|nr:MULTISPECIES: NUDIX domain-containing protein [unclassified Brevibacterium]OFL64052.1 NUDIX hydrolase [Brevibacterium sp. HMSC063G07]